MIGNYLVHRETPACTPVLLEFSKKTGEIANKKAESIAFRPSCNQESLDYLLKFAYLLLKRSTRPVVSTSFWVPVKNGWQAEQISTERFLEVVFVLMTLPQEHLISLSS